MASDFERISRRGSLAAACATLAVAAAGLIPTTASAGRFHVYSCRTPAGESAPVDGWSGSVAKGSAVDVYAKNSCPSGGALVAALGDQSAHLANVDEATWVFSPAASERLSGAALWRAGYLHSRAGESASYQFWLAGPGPTQVFDACAFGTECSSRGETAQPLSTANLVQVPGPNLGSALYVNASC